MNTNFIALTYLPGPAPLDVCVSAKVLDAYYDTQRILDCAHKKSTRILRDAENSAQQALSAATGVREEAYQEGLRGAHEEIERLRADTISQTVEWLVAEDELE
jgi:hypothetical protein